MPFKDKEAQKEASRLRQKALRDRRKGVTPEAEIVTPKPQNVTPSVTPTHENVTPTMADVQSGKAWQVLAGPNKGELRWYGPLAQKWRNIPCQVVDGICVAPHYEGRHVVPQPLDDGAVERARARLR